MKAIKITTENQAAIEAALLAVNGKANVHAYTTLSEIEALTVAAEAELESLGIVKTRRAGAAYRKTSGESVSNAYARKAHTRAATAARLERRGAGWYLTSVEATSVWQVGGGKGRLLLTQAQADEAIAAVKARFSVQTP